MHFQQVLIFLDAPPAAPIAPAVSGRGTPAVTMGRRPTLPQVQLNTLWRCLPPMDRGDGNFPRQVFSESIVINYQNRNLLDVEANIVQNWAFQPAQNFSNVNQSFTIEDTSDDETSDNETSDDETSDDARSNDKRTNGSDVFRHDMKVCPNCGFKYYELPFDHEVNYLKINVSTESCNESTADDCD